MSETILVRRDSAEIRWDSPYKAVDSIPWPSQFYLMSGPLLRITQVEISFLAQDQGWGNTGHSYVSFCVLQPDGTARQTKLLTLTHAETNVNVIITKSDDILDHFISGSCVGLLSVSAPYPGFSSKLKLAQMIIRHINPHRYDIAALRKQLLAMERSIAYQFFPTTAQNLPNFSIWDLFFDSTDTRLRSIHLNKVLTFLFLKSDDLIFSVIVKYLY